MVSHDERGPSDRKERSGIGGDFEKSAVRVGESDRECNPGCLDELALGRSERDQSIAYLPE